MNRTANWRARQRGGAIDLNVERFVQPDDVTCGPTCLTQVFRLTAERLQRSAWDASALRKLGTLEGIYQKLSDEAAARRLEILEWIIVALIALSILLHS